MPRQPRTLRVSERRGSLLTIPSVSEVNEVNAEASSAISKADFKSKSYIALKEARESMYWLELLHRNNYLTDIQFNSLYADAEELVKVLTHRCKKLDGVE